jgi:hypothetical protein
LRYVGDQQRKRLVAGAGLELVDVLDGAEVDGIDGEAIEGVGGQCDDLAAPQAFGHLLDKKRLRLIRMNAKEFCDQVCDFPCDDFTAFGPRGLCIGGPGLNAYTGFR